MNYRFRTAFTSILFCVCVGLLVNVGHVNAQSTATYNCTATLNHVSGIRAYRKDSPLTKISGTVGAQITCPNGSPLHNIAGQGDFLDISFLSQEALTGDCKNMATSLFNKLNEDAVLVIYFQASTKTKISLSQISGAPMNVSIEEVVPLSCSLNQPQI